MENKESFSYIYSAAQRQEIEDIRKKYLPQERDPMEQLRSLHNSASRKAQIWSLTLGILGALIMGTGMSLIMTDLPALLSIRGELALLIGIVLGGIGILLVVLAYPVYNRILKAERRRIAPEILRLSDELLK